MRFLHKLMIFVAKTPLRIMVILLLPYGIVHDSILALLVMVVRLTSNLRARSSGTTFDYPVDLLTTLVAWIALPAAGTWRRALLAEKDPCIAACMPAIL